MFAEVRATPEHAAIPEGVARNARIGLAVVVLLVGTLLAYWPGLHGGFLFDDYPNIVNNQAIQIERLDVDSLRAAAGAYKGFPGRPIATTSFALDYYIHGRQPWGYKASSMAVHLLNTGLVFLLALSVLRLPSVQVRAPSLVAFAVSMAWAVHPIQISTVLYIVQRMEMLSLTFVLLALLSYVRGRRRQTEGRRAWPWIALTVPLGALGLLAKESAALLPLYALALELTVLRFDAARPEISRWWKRLYAAGAIMALLAFLALLPAHLDPSLYRHRAFTLGERLLTQLRVLPMYLGQIVLPLPGSLQFYYDDLPVSRGLFSPITTALGAALLLVLAATAWLLRRRWPLFALGIGWFFAAHVLTSNIVPLELAFEHRNYFALFGVLLAIADLVCRIPVPSPAPLVRTLVAMVLVATAGLGAIRAATWGSPLLLATDMVAINPSSPRASVDLASRYAGLSGNRVDSPMYPLAVKEFERGASLPNASPLSEQGLILLAAMAGGRQEDAWWDSLDAKLRSRPIGAQERSALTSLMQRRYEGVAIDDRRLSTTYALFVERSGSPASLCVQYADYAHRYLHDDALSEHMYLRAVERAPEPTFVATLVSQLVAEDRGQMAARVLQHFGDVSTRQPDGSAPTP